MENEYGRFQNGTKGGIAGRLLSLVLIVAMLSSLMIMPASAASSVDSYLSKMSLRDKITQMMMVDFRVWDDGSGSEDFTVMNDEVRKIIEDYNFGAVIYFANNIKNTEDTFKLTMEVQKAATKDGGIPLIIATDQEGGSVYRLGSGTALPGNMALGATGDASYAYNAGKIIGSELSCLGINASLAPVVDVNNNANNPVIGLRSYSDDAATVGSMASSCIKGMAEYNVIGCAKHFPGHGDTATDSHYGLPIVDKPLDVLMENELLPYKIAISSGIEMIMTAHILYPQLESDTLYSEKTGKQESLPATMSDDILTGLLKGTLGFKGIICTDSMSMAGVSANWNAVQAVKNAIAAGVDLICMPTHLHSKSDLSTLNTIINSVEAAVKKGEIPESRLDDACRRILTVKENRGILDFDASDYSLDYAKKLVGCEENRAMERQMAADAVTLIQNKNDTLPLKLNEKSRVLMLTPYANELAQLAMGWNRAKEEGLIPDGAELRVLRFSSAALADYKDALDWADTVLINSEISSASSVQSNSWIYAGPRAFLQYAEDKGKTSIVMSVDKPYDVQLYPEADAVLAVYGCKGSSLDPTEALYGGITASTDACGPNITAGVEVALGVFGAKGTLPINVPELDSSTGTYGDKILYPRGYGLKYDALVHDFGDWVVTKEPSCTEFGVKTRYCSRCDATETKTFAKLGHKYIKTVVKPTASKQGYSEYACSVCGCSYKTDYTLAAPAVVLSNVASSGKIKLSWSKIDGADKYYIYRSSDGKSYEFHAGTTKTSYTDSKAAAGKKYYYKVKAVKIDDTKKTFSAYSPAKYRTCDLAMPVVKITTSKGDPKLSWAKITGATKYEVYRATSKSGEYTKMYTTAKTSYTNTSAKAGKTYYYKVKAICSTSAANSAYSTLVSIKAK